MIADLGLGRETRPDIGAEAIRWGASLALVLGLHAAFVWVMLSRRPPDLVLPAVPEAIMLELPPEPAPVQPEANPPTPVPEPTPTPPVPPASAPTLAPEPPTPEPPIPEQPIPEQRQPEPPPPEIQAQLPKPVPEAVLPLPPPPRPVPPIPAPPRPAPIRRTSPPNPPPRPSASPALPTPAAPPAAVSTPVTAPPAPPPTSSGNATATWRSELVSKLARAKRYPEAARTRGEQGTAMATFTMDRAGHVLSANVTRGSGSYLLDEEAVALIHRAEPLPALPAEIPGATLTLTVPIAFALR